MKRFGNTYTEEGSEKEGNLKYKFRSPNYSVDAMMSRRGNQLVSNVEVYYSDKPLQANGEPPIATVRGVMSVTAPGAKWHETTPVGTQKAAFKTADGVYLAVILPSDKSVDLNNTFIIAVGKVMDGGRVDLPGQRSADPNSQVVNQAAVPVPDESIPPREDQDPKYSTSDSLAVTLPTGKVVHFQTPEEKADYASAMGLNNVPAGSVAAPASQPLMVVGRTTQNGWEMLRLSNESLALPAKLEITAYGNNEIAADQTFKGQRIPIFGVIDSFGTDLFGYPYVVIDREPSSITAVQCTFDKSAAPTLATLQKGQVLALVGKHNGKLFNIQVSDCTLIPWQKFDDNPPVARHATPVPQKRP